MFHPTSNITLVKQHIKSVRDALNYQTYFRNTLDLIWVWDKRQKVNFSHVCRWQTFPKLCHICHGCNMCTCDLTDMYTWVQGSRPEGECTLISVIHSADVTTVMWPFHCYSYNISKLNTTSNYHTISWGYT